MASTTRHHGLPLPPGQQMHVALFTQWTPDKKHVSIVPNTTYLDLPTDPNLKQFLGHWTTAMSPRMARFFSWGLGGEGAFGFGGGGHEGRCLQPRRPLSTRKPPDVHPSPLLSDRLRRGATPHSTTAHWSPPCKDLRWNCPPFNKCFSGAALLAEFCQDNPTPYGTLLLLRSQCGELQFNPS